MRIVLFSVFLTTLMFAQAPAPTQGAIDGLVVNALTQEPIPEARVKLAQGSVEFEPLYARADAKGQFQFLNLGFGTYFLSVERPGFVRPGDSSGSRGQTPVNLRVPRPNVPARAGTPDIVMATGADGTLRAAVLVPLMPAAVVTGRITDPNGVPVSGVQVSLHIKAPLNPSGRVFAGEELLPDGKSRLQNVGWTQSNDRGEFRFGRLQPGTYYVLANRPFDWDNAYRNTYFPHAIDLVFATPIDLTAGQQKRADIQIVHQTGLRVAGRIIDAVGSAAGRRYTQLALVSRQNPSRSVGFTTAMADRFEIKDVLPGAYTLFAVTFDDNGNPMGVDRKIVSGVRQNIDLADRDLEDLAPELHPLPDLTDQVTFAEGCQASPVKVRVQGNFMFGPPPEVLTDSGGRFVLSGLTPGHYTPERYAAIVAGRPVRRGVGSLRRTRRIERQLRLSDIGHGGSASRHNVRPVRREVTMKLSLLFILTLASVVAAQTQAIEGYVVNSVTGQPVAGAYVSFRTGPSPVMTVSDSAGYFHLAASNTSYATITRTGFLRRNQTFGGKPAQATAPLRVDLIPESVISGRVIDEDGFPVFGVIIQPMRYNTVDGERRLAPFSSGGQIIQTNDLGEFRLAGLPAGRYFLRLAPMTRLAWDARYTTQFFPGTLEPRDESAIEVKTGEEHGQVEFRLAKHEGVVVAGRVGLPGGAALPAQGLVVELRTQGTNFQTMAMVPAQRDGRFFMPHVPPGSYILYARSGITGPMPKAGDLWAQQQLQVSTTDVRDVSLQLRTVEPVDVQGTVVFEGDATPQPIAISLRGNMGASAWAKSGEDGKFVLKGLLPGHYYVQAMPERPTASSLDAVQRLNFGRLTSVRWDDVEVPQRDGFNFDGVSTAPLRITFSGPVATVTGQLMDSAGQPVAGRMLLMIGETPEAMAFTQTGTDGVFTAPVMKAGLYHVYAVNDFSDMQSPEYLKAHETDFPPLRIAAGKNGPVALRMAARP